MHDYLRISLAVFICDDMGWNTKNAEDFFNFFQKSLDPDLDDIQ